MAGRQVWFSLLFIDPPCMTGACGKATQACRAAC